MIETAFVPESVLGSCNETSESVASADLDFRTDPAPGPEASEKRALKR
jgi:hypothetical protein